MDIGTLMKLSGAWNTFKSNHPKFPGFLKAVKDRGLAEGMTIDICCTYPDGSTLKSGIRVHQSDIELMESLAGMAEGRQ